MNKSLLFLVATLMLSGCSRSISSGPEGEFSNLTTWVAAIKALPVEAPEPLPVILPPERQNYTAVGERDPFSQPAAPPGSTPGLRPDTGRPRQALEAFELDSLKMVGTIGQGGNRRALVSAPDGMTYQVRPGSYLGKNEGRVVGLDDGQLNLMEVVQSGAEWVERPASISME